MEVIAERAGLTRGTLDRNFAHRQAMYEAVLERDLERDLERVAKLVEAERRDNPLAFIRHMAELMMIYDRFLVHLANMADYDVAANEARMAHVLAGPLAAAQAQGLLRADLTTSDVLMTCRMLASHWKLDGQSDFEAAFEQRLALLTRGLRGLIDGS